MRPVTWRGIDFLIVAPLMPSRCTGCVFNTLPNDTDDECPHTDESVDFLCGVNNDVIFIKDTEEAMAEYVAKKLTG